MSAKKSQKGYIVAAAISLTIASFFYVLARGMPLHDFRLWRLKRNFQAAALYHPPESMLVERKTYLGGPYDHGSFGCDLFVGELRSAPLRKENIRQAYDGRSIRAINHFSRTPLKVLFFDEGVWPMDSPLGQWWDEWYLGGGAAALPGTAYFVYAAQEGYSPLGDLRCD